MASKVLFNEKYPYPGQVMHGSVCFPGCKPFVLTNEGLEKIHDFEVRDSDVAILSYPRTGSLWTCEVVSWICSECDEEMISNTTRYERIPRLELHVISMSVDAAEILNQTTRVFRTHLRREFAPAEIEKAKLIILLRNPKDNAVSYYHFHRLFKLFGFYKGSWEEFLQGYMDGALAFGSYFVWLKNWWPLRHQENVLFLKYEESKNDPVKMVTRIADFLGKTLSEDQVQLIVEKTSFTAMKNSPNTNIQKDPKCVDWFDEEAMKTTEFVRKGEVGDWKNYFTVKQNEMFDELIKKELAGMELEFEYEN